MKSCKKNKSGKSFSRHSFIYKPQTLIHQLWLEYIQRTGNMIFTLTIICTLVKVHIRERHDILDREKCFTTSCSKISCTNIIIYKLCIENSIILFNYVHVYFAQNSFWINLPISFVSLLFAVVVSCCKFCFTASW